MAQSEIEPATFQMVQHCLNRLHVHKFVTNFIYVCREFVESLFEILNVDTVCTVCGFVTLSLARHMKDMICSLAVVIVHRRHTHPHTHTKHTHTTHINTTHPHTTHTHTTYTHKHTYTQHTHSTYTHKHTYTQHTQTHSVEKYKYSKWVDRQQWWSRKCV